MGHPRPKHPMGQASQFGAGRDCCSGTHGGTQCPEEHGQEGLLGAFFTHQAASHCAKCSLPSAHISALQSTGTAMRPQHSNHSKPHPSPFTDTDCQQLFMFLLWLTYKSPELFIYYVANW